MYLSIGNDTDIFLDISCFGVFSNGMDKKCFVSVSRLFAETFWTGEEEKSLYYSKDILQAVVSRDS